MNKPVWVTENGGDVFDVNDIANGWGLEVLVKKEVGKHRDLILLFRNFDGQIGLLVFGDSSCAAIGYYSRLCLRALKSEDWSEVVEYSKSLLRRIHWENSMEELMAWVDESSKVGSHWWTYHREAIEWLNSYGAHLDLPDY